MMESSLTPGKRSHSLSILFLGTQMAVGGAQKLLLGQADWFRNKGHHVTAAFFYDRDGLQQQWEHQANFALHNLRAFDPTFSSLQKIAALIKGLFKLWTLMRTSNFDAVITFTHDSNVLGLPLAWLAHIPVRVATHLGRFRSLPRWRELANTWLVNAGIGQVLIAASEKTRRDALEEGVHTDQIIVIPNGITPVELQSVDAFKIRERLGLSPDNVFLLVVGRLVYEKGHEVLIQAMSTVIRENPHVRAAICGHGPLRESLQTEISQRRLTEHVKLLDTCDNISEMLAAADIFVLPSRSEGLSLALLEAMAAGLPVIATRVQGVEDVVQDGVHGFLVAPDDPDKLGHAILKMSSDPEQRRRMGEASTSRVTQNYTTDHMCEQYLKVIEELLKPREPKALNGS